MNEARRVLGDAPSVSYATSPLAACEGADALVVVTEWQEFRSPDFEALKRRLRTPLIFDGRNLYNPSDVRARASNTSGSAAGELTMSSRGKAEGARMAAKPFASFQPPSRAPAC